MVRTGGKREIWGKDSKSPAEFVKEIGGVFFRMVPDGAHLPHPQSGSSKKKRLGTRSVMMAVNKRARRFVLRFRLLTLRFRYGLDCR